MGEIMGNFLGNSLLEIMKPVKGTIGKVIGFVGKAVLGIFTSIPLLVVAAAVGVGYLIYKNNPK